MIEFWFENPGGIDSTRENFKEGIDESEEGRIRVDLESFEEDDAFSNKLSDSISETGGEYSNLESDIVDK